MAVPGTSGRNARGSGRHLALAGQRPFIAPIELVAWNRPLFGHIALHNPVPGRRCHRTFERLHGFAVAGGPRKNIPDAAPALTVDVFVLGTEDRVTHRP